MKKNNKIKCLRNEIDPIKEQIMMKFYAKRKWLNAKRQKNG